MLVGAEFDQARIPRFVYQPGAGVDVKTLSGMIIRLEGDYRFVRGSARNSSGARLMLGIVIE
jgi:hypothetical protein